MKKKRTYETGTCRKYDNSGSKTALNEKIKESRLAQREKKSELVKIFDSQLVHTLTMLQYHCQSYK